MTGHQPRICLVEDHQLVAEALRFSLSLRSFHVVTVPLPAGRVNSAPALVDAITQVRPRVVLLDLDLGRAGDGASLIRPLVRSGHPTIVVTASESPVRWGQCLTYGAATVLAKSASLDEIERSIRLVLAGREPLSGERRNELVGAWRRHVDAERGVRAALGRLSRREREVLDGLARGLQVRDIARASHVSEATVRTQVKSILLKLGVSSQIAAVALVRDAGPYGEERAGRSRPAS